MIPAGERIGVNPRIKAIQAVEGSLRVRQTPVGAPPGREPGSDSWTAIAAYSFAAVSGNSDLLCRRLLANSNWTSKNRLPDGSRERLAWLGHCRIDLPGANLSAPAKEQMTPHLGDRGLQFDKGPI